MPQPHSPHTEQILIPDFADWAVQACSYENTSLDELRASARRRFVDEATRYVSRLRQVALDAGLPSDALPVPEGDTTGPLIMTGHQPSIFHPGLVFKYTQAEKFSNENQATALGIIIDTDIGDPGEFAFPTATGDRDSLLDVSTGTATFSAGAGLYPDCRMHSAGDLNAQIQRVETAISGVLRPSAQHRFQCVAAQYRQLIRASMMEANLIFRRLHGIGNRLLELPLSHFCVFPETVAVIAGILNRSHEFAATYNRLLDEFRSDHHIRNRANPFPDLDISEQHCELPFWVLNHSTQERLTVSVRRTGSGHELTFGDVAGLSWQDELTPALLQDVVDGGFTLVPRGALITGLLRLLVSDLFVHGTGGGKYDVFTDRLITAWWGVRSTPFVVASATRMLMPERTARLDHLEQLATQLRELSHNPQRFLGSGIFTPQCEALLQDLLEEKQYTVDALQQARAEGISGKEIGAKLQRLTRRIKSLVEDQFRAEMEELEAISNESRSTLRARTWPWFFFSDPDEPSAECRS